MSPLTSLGTRRIPLPTRGPISTEADTGFLGQVGRFLDVGLGGAFIRNILAGEGEAALRSLPIIGLASAPSSGYAPSGRQLLDRYLGPGDWGQISDIAPFLFGEPKSGALIERNGFWDWTAKGVAGFAAEVLLDPATYLGIGGLTRAGRALKLAGSSENARRIILLGASREGFESLSKLERSILPTLRKLDGKLPLDLMPTFAEQAKTGQRALFAFDVPFTDIATPLMQAPGAFEVFGRAGRWLRASTFGEAFLKRPGSATGNQVFNDFSKTMVQIAEGLKSRDTFKINEALAEMTSTAKTLLHPDERTPEKIAETVRGWLNATEMSSAFKLLPKKEKEMVDVLRGFMDDFFERDILSGVNVTPLDDFRRLEIDKIATLLDGVPQDFAKRAGKIFSDTARASLGRKESFNRIIQRRIRLGTAGVGDDFVRALESIDGTLDEIERVALQPGQTARVASQAQVLTAKAVGLDKRFDMLIRQFRDEAGKVKLTGRKTTRYNRLEASITEIGNQLDSTISRLNKLDEPLSAAGLGKARALIERQRKIIENRRVLQPALKLEKAAIGGLDDLVEPITPSAIEAQGIRKLAQVGVAVARQGAKKEGSYLDQLMELGNRMVDEVVPEDQIARELERLAPRAQKSGPSARQAVQDLTETLENMNKTNLSVDDYLTHVPTLAAREWLEKQFPDMFRAATYEWRLDHASTLRRSLAGGISEINERFRNVLDGGDFFTTDPGVILATRALRTSTAETISQFAEGALRMRNVGVDALQSLDDALSKGATLGTTPREVLAGALEFGADTPARQQSALDNIRKVLTQSSDVVGKDGLVTKPRFLSAVADLDNLMRRHSNGVLGLPKNRQVLETWRRKNLVPKVFDTEVADSIDRMMDVLRGEPTVIGRIPRWIQKITRPWKIITLMPWPQYHSRNFYSEWFLNFLAGMQNPAVAGDMAWRSMNVIWAETRRRGLKVAGDVKGVEKWESRLRNMKFKTRDGVIDGAELVDQFRRLGLDEGFQRSELNMLLSPVDQVTQINVASKARGVVGKFAQAIGDTGPGRMVKGATGGLMKSAFALNNFVERHPRLAQFIWELENNGRSFKDAGLEVVKRHYSYNSLSFTKFENQLRASVIPFFSWTRNNVPAMFREFVKFPRRGSVVANLFGTSQFTPEELQAMPEWVRDSVKLRTSKKGVITRFGLPFEDIMEWWSDPGRKALTSLHPAAQGAIEFGTGRRVFTGKPIAQDTIIRDRRLPDIVEVLGNAALGRLASAGRKIQDIRSGRLRFDEFSLSFFLGPKIQQFDAEESNFNRLQEAVRKLQDEGVVKTFEIPFISKDDKRSTPEIRKLLKEFRSASKKRSQRRKRRR